MNLKCRCGFFHYNLDQYTKIHGKSKEFIDPYIQVPFVDDQIWNEKDHDYTQPLPLITKKWICQFCGKQYGHESDCDYFNQYEKK